MGLFKNALNQRNIQSHDGRSLWKYSLTDTEFTQLKNGLTEARGIFDLDFRDCALYYAEWWKRCYNGGLPSKVEVFQSIKKNQLFDEEEFYRYARKGANLLGVRWIKNQNTLYFKTLLLQGGLPVKHLSNHKGAYMHFLLEILKINPKSIDDFAFETSVTSILPKSSRNDEIYECCLDIVKAIYNEDNEYLTLLDSNDELKEISNYLRINKPKVRPSPTKTKYKTNWVLEPASEKIRLYFRITDVIDSSDFRKTFLKSDLELDFEYTLFYNDIVLCKFNRRANDNYRVSWINQKSIFWDGTYQFPELMLISLSGEKINCKELINYLPDLGKPTLWTKYSEGQWLLEKGRNTNQEEAFVLHSINYHFQNDLQSTELNLYGLEFKLSPFTETITISNTTNDFIFQACTSKIEWYIVEDKPNWIQKANMPIVRNRPKIFVYDQKDNLVTDIEIKWRQNRGQYWNDFNVPIPVGLVEIQIRALNITETDSFFNIGGLEVEVISNSLQEAQVKLSNNQFEFNIYENQLIEIIKISEIQIKLILKSNTSIPDSIHASIKRTNQSTSLSFEIRPPFKGIEIIDNNQNIVNSSSIININNLYGYRLMSNQENLVICFQNSKANKIVISERLIDKFIPLRLFEEKINQLFSLSDSMDNETEVKMEIFEVILQKHVFIKEYRIKKFSHEIKSFFDDEVLKISTTANNVDLFAIPLDCSINYLHLYDLAFADGFYTFKNQNVISKFIVFNSKESFTYVQPTFISLDPNNIETSLDDRTIRVSELSQELLESKADDEIWKKLLTYYDLCLNQGLQFSTFDIIRAIGFSSEICAKAFVFLVCYDESATFLEEVSKKLEEDLGFSFHWINKAHWIKAMEWIGCFAETKESIELLALIGGAINTFYDNLYPSTTFKKLSNYILKDISNFDINGFHLNSKISELRGSLGERVLTQLPTKCPKIIEEYKNIIPINEDTRIIKIVLKSPLAVALSIKGKDESIWDSSNEEIRRYIKYSQQLNPEWYSEAIIYCMGKIKS